MSSVNVVEEWVTLSDGQKQYTKTWKVTPSAKAHLVVIHGFGDHCSRYDPLCRVFAEHGIESHGIDERGWGETGKRDQSFGNNQGYNTALSDINEAVNRTKQPGVPLFLLGHSMGGGLILNYTARKEQYDGVAKITGAIASAPLVTLTTPVNAIKYHGLKLVSHLLPSFGIRADLNPEAMSHDLEEIEKYKNDPLVHDFTTIGTAGGFLEAGKDLLTIGSKITTPILFSHGDADPVNLYASTKRVYEITSSSDKELKTWEGLLHELHHERKPDRDAVAEYYTNWIKHRIPQ